MPLFDRELNDLADRIGRDELRIWLHTAAPTNADPTNGRTNVGGGAYENGAVLAAAGISAAADGDISNTGVIDFGAADEAVGDITHWSAVRGGDAVGYGTLPATTVADGETIRINAGTLQFNGSTT